MLNFEVFLINHTACNARKIDKLTVDTRFTIRFSELILGTLKCDTSSVRNGWEVPYDNGKDQN